MTYIIAYRLIRKNARRKVYSRMNCIDEHDALMQFKAYCDMRQRVDDKAKQWELLRGDWKHIKFYENGELK